MVRLAEASPRGGTEGLGGTNLRQRIFSARTPSRSGRALRLVLTAVLFLALGRGAAGYNNSAVPCGTWPNANPVTVQWTWGPDINTSGPWAYAFATVAEPNWDDSFTKLSLGYNSSASGEYDVYYSSTDGLAGHAYTWCHWWDPDQLADFLAEGNTYAYSDSGSYQAFMGNTAGHEIGHSLGYGHSTYDAVMKSGYGGSWPTTDDRDGFSAMYP